MRKCEIPVAFTPDENYMLPTCVSILSMLATKRDETQYKFFIVVSDKIDRECLKYLERVENLRTDFVYQVIFINSDEFDEQKITTPHLTTSAYYRLILADLLPEYEKCMYHDGDILVNADLQEMFDVDLNDHYVAGVKAIVKHQDTPENRAALRRWGFPSFDNYIISSDLIFNLAKIREDNLTEKFREEMNKGYPSEDQDVLNYCCYGKIAFLPLKYAMLPRWLNADVLAEMKNKVYTDTEIVEAKRSPAIMHYAGKYAKPWYNLRVYGGETWWNYAQRLLNDEEYRFWRRRAEAETEQRDWRFLKRRIDSYQSVIIFGYSQIGRKVFDAVSRWGHHIPCIIDNDQAKQGQCYEGCTVMDAESALSRFGDSVIVNTSQRFAGTIRRQLLNLGVSTDHIIDFVNKSSMYYLSIDPQYYDEELRDLFVKELG